MAQRWTLLISFAVMLSACNPFKAEVPEVRDGITAYESKQYDDALKRFDDALAQESSAEAQVGRGAALYAQQKYAEAAEALRRALNTDDDALKARAFFDLGNAEAKGGKLDEAIESYRRSLQLNPADPDARFNLEWALRMKEEQKKKQDKQKKENGGDDTSGEKDQSTDKQNDGDKAGGGQDGAKDGSSPESKTPPSDSGQQPGQPEQKQDQPSDKGEGKGEADSKTPPPSPGGGDNQPAQEQQATAPPTRPGEAPRAMDRQEAAAVLDALQAGEKNLQMWRFQKPQSKERRGRAQDW